MDTMLRGSQPYVAPKLRNSSRPMLDTMRMAQLRFLAVRSAARRSREPRTRDLMIIQVSGWVYRRADPDRWLGWAGGSGALLVYWLIAYGLAGLIMSLGLISVA